MQINENISRNFNFLKFFSIILVFFGHFFADVIPMIWVPVTVALIVFSFSSGYFTSLKYKDNYNIKEFWVKKFQRLGVNLFLINLLLFFWFLIQDKTGLWTWQTIVNLLGLNGFLNWFHINNLSPYGRGMWFFTLLLIFYVLYPLLEKIKQRHWHVFIIVFIILSYIVSMFQNVGHALYITASGFMSGMYVGKCQISVPPKLSRWLAVLILMSMLILNFMFENNRFNFFFILFFSIFFIFSTVDIKINDHLFGYATFFSACILEIYLLHQYFFFHLTGLLIVDFLLSLLSVLVISKMLSQFSSILVASIQRY